MFRQGDPIGHHAKSDITTELGPRYIIASPRKIKKNMMFPIVEKSQTGSRNVDQHSNM